MNRVKFLEDIKTAREKGNKQFLLNNLDIEEYKRLTDPVIEKTLEDLDRTQFSSDETEDEQIRERRKNQFKNSIDITSEAFDGFEKLINGTNQTWANFTWVAPGGTMSATTVIANLNQVINQLPPALIGSTDTKLYMNRTTAQFYRQAITALGYMQMFQAGDEFNLQFNGYDIYVCPGMSNGTVIAAQPSNLFVGVDANSDFAEVRVVDMSLTDASDNVRMAMRFRTGVQVGVYGDVVIGSNT